MYWVLKVQMLCSLIVLGTHKEYFDRLLMYGFLVYEIREIGDWGAWQEWGCEEATAVLGMQPSCKLC